MSLIEKVLFEKKEEEGKRKRRLEFLNKFTSLFETYTYEIFEYFGERFVEFEKDKIFKFKIHQHMVEFILSLESKSNKEDGFIVTFRTYPDIQNGTTEENIGSFSPSMSDDEMEEEIENCILYLLRAVML